MEAIRYEEHYTLEDYRRWEGDWELIGGRPYAMSPAPGITHQTISLNIAMAIREAIEKCAECLVVQDVDYEVSEDTVVRPDVVVVCGHVEEKVTKAPRIVFEIISPSTARRDETAKYELYRREGVEYYALVYPAFKTLKLYRLDENGNYRKVDDFRDELIEFDLKECPVTLDTSHIWPTER